jgi:hypothetical protein
MQTLDPLSGAGKRSESFQSHEFAIKRFLCVADALDVFDSRVHAEPLRNNRIIALAEAHEEILMGDVDAFAVERVLPSPPMILLRVDVFRLNPGLRHKSPALRMVTNRQHGTLQSRPGAA